MDERSPASGGRGMRAPRRDCFAVRMICGHATERKVGKPEAFTDMFEAAEPSANLGRIPECPLRLRFFVLAVQRRTRDGARGPAPRCPVARAATAPNLRYASHEGQLMHRTFLVPSFTPLQAAAPPAWSGSKARAPSVDRLLITQPPIPSRSGDDWAQTLGRDDGCEIQSSAEGITFRVSGSEGIEVPIEAPATERATEALGDQRHWPDRTRGVASEPATGGNDP